MQKSTQKILNLMLCFIYLGTLFFYALSLIKSDTPTYAHASAQTHLWQGEVPHFFTHCLLANPKLAFAPDTQTRKSYYDDCLTATEFSNILQNLYDNGYALVDIAQTYSLSNEGIASKRAFEFPINKKPFVMSIDDVVYDARKLGTGMVDKLVLKNGRIQSSTKLPNGETLYSTSNEFVPILEDFIRLHPDFSYNNARGIICLTGFAGILGYRTQENSPTRTQEIKEVQPIVAKLKQDGWRFASHTFAHAHQNRLTLTQLRADLEKWQAQVQPLVGQTELYTYPYGEWDSADKAKVNLIHEYGFKVAFGVGIYDCYRNFGVLLHQDRKPMDGYSLSHRQEHYAPYFDCARVFDAPARQMYKH